MNKTTRKKIEFYLYNYNYIDTMIKNIITKKINEEYNQSYTRFIKNKSSSLEDLVIRNINQQRISKIKKWQNLIKNIIEEYQRTNNLKYSFIFLRYFKRKNPIVIENKLNISIKQQKDIKNEILNYIFFCAIKQNMLVKEVNYK